jgi:hypothetical protein
MSGCDSTQPDEAECSGCDESLDSATKSGKKNDEDNYKKIKFRTVQSQEPATLPRAIRRISLEAMNVISHVGPLAI